MSTSFTFQVIPLKQVPMENEVTKQPPAVLVVDDEKVIADTLSIILSRQGFLVETAYNAESALERARRISPDLLLSDVMLGPGLDGMQLAMELTKSHADCKVILFSGHTSTHDLIDKAHRLGRSFTCLSKPLHPAELLGAICECLGYLPMPVRA